MASTSSAAIPSIYSSAKLNSTHHRIFSVSPSSLQPASPRFSKLHIKLSFSRSRISYPVLVATKRDIRVSTGTGLLDGESVTDPEPGADNTDSSASLNVKLPRRSLLVQFTCNSCGGETKRLVNRLAYERGLVFVQCAGCLKHHKLVDNLGLIVEYDFREDKSFDSGTDQM